MFALRPAPKQKRTFARCLLSQLSLCLARPKSNAPLVNDFVLRYPELDVDMKFTNQILDLVAEGYDLAVRMGKLEDSTLMARRLASHTLYVCASPSYLASHGTPHSLSELTNHNCLLGNLDYWRFQEAGQPRNVRATGNIRCDSGRALLDAALKGIGIVQLPDYYVQAAVDSRRLIPVLTHYQEDDDGIWAVYPHDRHLPPKVRLLLDFFLQNRSHSAGQQRARCAGTFGSVQTIRLRVPSPFTCWWYRAIPI